MTQKRISIFALVLGALGVLFSQPTLAATIQYRADLVDRITNLQRIFPPQDSLSILGAAPDRISDSLWWLCDSRPECRVISVTGVIENGDSEKLKALLDDWSKPVAVIVFDSPGGSFLEGLRLAATIREAWDGNDTNLGGVAVLSEMECMSACALAFAGAVDQTHVAEDARFIEHGAKLGFHMGILPGEKASALVPAEQALSLAYDIVGEYSALIANNLNPAALLQKALKYKSADDFYIVEADITAWALGFSPVSSGHLSKQIITSAIDNDVLDALCNTLFSYGRVVKTNAEWEFGSIYSSSQGDPAATLSDHFPSPPLRLAYNSEGFNCQVGVDSSRHLSLTFSRGNAACLDSPVGDLPPSPWCHTAASGAMWKVTVGLLADVLGCPAGNLMPLAKFNPYADARSGTVKRDVNMREAASLDAGIVSQLTAGTKVKVVGCQLVDDSQAVWFSVQADNRYGWVSARFIDENKFLFSQPLDED